MKATEDTTVSRSCAASAPRSADSEAPDALSSPACGGGEAGPYRPGRRVMAEAGASCTPRALRPAVQRAAASTVTG